MDKFTILGFSFIFSVISKRQHVPKLSEQRHAVKDAAAPMPLDTCLHVKKNKVAQDFCGKIIRNFPNINEEYSLK